MDKREGVEEEIKGKKKELGQLTRELAGIEKEMREKVPKLLNVPSFCFCDQDLESRWYQT